MNILNLFKYPIFVHEKSMKCINKPRLTCSFFLTFGSNVLSETYTNILIRVFKNAFENLNP